MSDKPTPQSEEVADATDERELIATVMLSNGQRGKRGRTPKVGNKACSSLVSPKDKLTAKQEKFAQLVANGKGQSEAYRMAYDAKGMADQTIWTQASLLASNQKVANRISSLKAVVIDRDWQDMTKMRHKALKRLADECDGVEPDTKAATRVAAAVAIGKIREINLFADHKVVEHRDDSRLLELKTKLEQRLKTLFPQAAPALLEQGQAEKPVADDGTPTGGGTPL